MGFPKVLVGCPTSEHKRECLRDFSVGVKRLSYPNFDVLILDNSLGEEYIKEIRAMGLNAEKSPYFEKASERVIHARNILRKKVLDEGYDYLLILEQDVIPPSDVIERMVVKNEKIVSGVTFHLFESELDGKKMLQMRPLIGEWDKNAGIGLRFYDTDNVIKAFHNIYVGYCAFGCALIHRDVLSEISFRFEEQNGVVFWDDYCFCKDVFGKHKILADLSLKCKHMVLGRKEGWDRIRE